MREASVERMKDAVIGAYRQRFSNTLEAGLSSWVRVKPGAGLLKWLENYRAFY